MQLCFVYNLHSYKGLYYTTQKALHRSHRSLQVGWRGWGFSKLLTGTHMRAIPCVAPRCPDALSDGLTPDIGLSYTIKDSTQLEYGFRVIGAGFPSSQAFRVGGQSYTSSLASTVGFQTET